MKAAAACRWKSPERLSVTAACSTPARCTRKAAHTLQGNGATGNSTFGGEWRHDMGSVAPKRPASIDSRCTGCLACIEICPRDALTVTSSAPPVLVAMITR